MVLDIFIQKSRKKISKNTAALAVQCWAKAVEQVSKSCCLFDAHRSFGSIFLIFLANSLCFCISTARCFITVDAGSLPRKLLPL